jgi:hypothetical protein
MILLKRQPLVGILLVFKLIPYCDYYLSSVVKGPDLLLTSHRSACSKLKIPALLPNIRPLAYH